MNNEIVVNLYGDERITLTLEDLKKLIVKKIELGAMTKKAYFEGGIVGGDITTPLSDINDLFFYMTKDAMEGKITSEKFRKIMDKLALYVENEVKNKEDSIMIWESAETLGFLFALSQMVIVARGYGGEMIMWNGQEEEKITEAANREDWAESFKKTLKALGVKE